MAKYLCMDLPQEPEELPEELLVSSEEIDIVEDEIGREEEKWDALLLLHECQGNVVQALTNVADELGMTYESLLSEISTALSELNEGCRQLLADPDLREGVPQLVGALTGALLTYTAIAKPWALVVAACVVIACKKGVRLYLV